MDYESMWKELHNVLIDEDELGAIMALQHMVNVKAKYATLIINKPLTASAMGKAGGSSKSTAKTTASRANGKLGGRPRKVKEVTQ